MEDVEADALLCFRITVNLNIGGFPFVVPSGYGRTFEVEVPEAVAAPKRRGGGGGKKKRSGTVSSSIPGKVVTVEVSEGQRVEEGQVILILKP